MNSAERSNVFSTFVGTGLVAGTMDAIAASCQYYLRTGKSPAAVWRYVAGALVAADAAVSSEARVAIGLLMHYAIAFTWTALFFFAASRLLLLRGNPWIIGPLYGVFVWVMMARVLVPLTRIGPPKTFDPAQAAIAAAILVVCIGIPIALGAKRAYN